MTTPAPAYPDAPAPRTRTRVHLVARCARCGLADKPVNLAGRCTWCAEAWVISHPHLMAVGRTVRACLVVMAGRLLSRLEAGS